MSIAVRTPPNVGWLEKKLSSEEIEHLWKCVEAGGDNCNSNLAGNITGSHIIPDLEDKFFYRTLLELTNVYEENFKNMANKVAVNQMHMLTLETMWVNYQKETEFQPNHEHNGVYSFVVWMKMPTSHKEQNEGNITNAPKRSSFEFCYNSILGDITTFAYDETPEGMMLFFPSKLCHQVYPFYNCNETRISISGNLCLDTSTSYVIN